MDWNAKEQELGTATIAAFDDFMASLQGERLYVICLQTDDSGMNATFCANTEEGYVQNHAALAQSGFLTPQDVASVRWDSAEWRYEMFGYTHFTQVNRAFNKAGSSDSEEDFGIYFAQLIETMIAALAMLRAERAHLLGNVTLFVTITDSDEARAIEDRSVTLLNPAPLAEAFLRRFG